MVEFPDAQERAAMLTQLVGIEDKVWMQIGDNPRISPSLMRTLNGRMNTRPRPSIFSVLS